MNIHNWSCGIALDDEQQPQQQEPKGKKQLARTDTLYIRDRLPFTANVRDESRQMLHKTKLREDISGDK